MEKLKMESLNMAQCNIEKIGALFPQVITEAVDDSGKLVKAIDFEKLRQELSSELLGDGEESYDFTWVGKNQAIAEANEPIRKTLRPVVETETVPTGEDSKGNPYCSSGSKNFDATENLYIEGDNLDVLKLLQESYLNSVKMIYIDPPYNTGKDSFVYPDNYMMDKDEYDEITQVRNEDGEVVFKQNNETNARFHSDWCSMIYMRLRLAKNLLADDGVIFISIDDNEVDNLKKICNEIFGEDNFVANLIWQKKFSRSNDAKYFSTMHDNIICCAKKSLYLSDDGWKIGLIPRGDEIPKGYANPDNDPRGLWTSVVLSAKSGSDKLKYDITTPSGRIVSPPSGRFWSVSREKYKSLINDNRLWFGVSGDGTPRLKTFLNEVQDGLRPNTILFHEEVGHNQEGKQETKALFDGVGVFDGPKPIRLLEFILKIANTNEDAIILDFFSGSATTAHAVMKLNAEDGGNRKFICVQLPETTYVMENGGKVAVKGSEEAFKAGYRYICEIGKERIRRAGEKIKAEVEASNAQLKIGEEPKQVPDIGFRVLKLDSTNMKDVYYGAEEITQTILGETLSNIKEDRTGLDLLYGVLLDWGLELSSSCETLSIDGVTVYNYDDASLVACLEDKKVSETAIREIAKMQPTRVVFRDSSFENSADKINVEEIFKLTAPGTSVRVI